ncbi:MAG: glycerate kinase type-2 family protein [Candidatus Levyibacteriota bacterium]
MGYIKNYDSLAINDNRKVVLDLAEAAYTAIQPQHVFEHNFSIKNDTLKIFDQSFDLSKFDGVFLLGFGKGSAGNCKWLEEKLGDRVIDGYDIDVVEDPHFKKMRYTKGTHPLPSEQNIAFTKHAIEHLEQTDEKTLVLVVTCGGGSVLFEAPNKLTLDQVTEVNKALLESGANITEMNATRKHLSRVKGGGLAKLLYPATVVNLIFSDVPGNDLSVIASGPLVADHSTMDDVKKIIAKYELDKKVNLPPDAFDETPTDPKYFENVHNILMLSNLTALNAMEKLAKEKGFEVHVMSDRLQGDAHTLGQQLIDETPQGQILIAGGESTIKIKGHGKGGRNQALVLSQLKNLPENVVLASFGSDGWDYYELAGAIADADTKKKAEEMGLNIQTYLEDDNSYEFWDKTGDGIRTGHLDSNVSDLYIVLKFN